MRHRAERRRPWSRSRTLAATAVVLGVAAAVVPMLMPEQDTDGAVTAVPRDESDSSAPSISPSLSPRESTGQTAGVDEAQPSRGSRQPRPTDPTVRPSGSSPTAPPSAPRTASAPSTASAPTDSAAPQTRIVDGPADGDSEAVFAFAADETASYHCRLDDATYSPCGSSQTYGGLRPGRHTLSVRAVDEAGNVDPSPAEWTWRASKGTPD